MEPPVRLVLDSVFEGWCCCAAPFQHGFTVQTLTAGYRDLREEIFPSPHEAGSTR